MSRGGPNVKTLIMRSRAHPTRSDKAISSNAKTKAARTMRPGRSDYRLDRFARIGHGGSEASVDGKCLAIDIGGLVAGEEESHRRDLVRLTGALQWIQLA